ncbi:MAG: pilus assembly protein [Candidatus Dormibacteraeota bacterium]|uniref:Pilus assembly protein n=1 Tax=Candidatus Amunia macphersoniae TaxID=3127014 RepID=A0A934KRY4_9BACT|nr:pilus assembly protein [Candidatus Dormibacteraeota bacterium]
MIRRSPRRRRQHGQALIETAVVITVLLTLLTGVYAVSQYASDQNTAGTATRAGARLAAELGNGGFQSGASANGCQLVANGGTGSSTDPCAVDFQIVQVVCQIAASMPFVTSVDEIDVYRPLTTNGQDGSIGDLYDKYTSCAPNRHADVPGPAYRLDQRLQVHPNESYVGVSLRYHYKSPTPFVSLTAMPTVYTVLQESPHFT